MEFLLIVAVRRLCISRANGMIGEKDEDDAFEELLKSVARTPDVSALRRELVPGSELLGRFVTGRQLGEGGMGRVFAAFDRERQAKVGINLLGS